MFLTAKTSELKGFNESQKDFPRLTDIVLYFKIIWALLFLLNFNGPVVGLISFFYPRVIIRINRIQKALCYF